MTKARLIYLVLVTSSLLAVLFACARGGFGGGFGLSDGGGF